MIKVPCLIQFLLQVFAKHAQRFQAMLRLASPDFAKLFFKYISMLVWLSGFSLMVFFRGARRGEAELEFAPRRAGPKAPGAWRAALLRRPRPQPRGVMRSADGRGVPLLSCPDNPAEGSSNTICVI